MAEDCERTLLRRELIRELLEEERSVSELSTRYGVSRNALHKWKKRYEQEGLKGLEPKSRRPHRSPKAVISRQWKEEVLGLKRRRRHWGAKKLVAELKRLHADKAIVSERTVGRLLRAAGLTHDRRRRSQKNGPLIGWPNRPVASAPNRVWAIDFKGDFFLQDGTRVYPLTMEDLYSRFLLELRALKATTFLAVKASCRRVFRAYGLPQGIVVDNGIPFAGEGLLGLSRLSSWWMSLGIKVYFIEPSKPYQNGQLERLHGTLKIEATQPPSINLKAQQRRFDRWREYYNRQRPHEAIVQHYPSELYVPGPQPSLLEPPVLHYPSPMLERYVKSGGEFNFGGKLYFLSEALSGYHIGLKPIAAGKFEIFWDQLLIGLLEPAAEQPIRLARRKKKSSQSQSKSKHPIPNLQHLVIGNLSGKK
jgi:transposase InsO family protein